jgi:threonine aldolase
MRDALFQATEKDQSTLEKRVANLFKKEAALFVPTGTLSNLIAKMVCCDTTTDTIVIGDRTHMKGYEARAYGNSFPRLVRNYDDGTLDLTQLDA